MKKMLVVSTLLAASLWMTGCDAQSERPAAPGPAGSGFTQTNPDSAAESKTVPEFHSIEIDVLAADIRIVPGEDWSVSYNLSKKEPVKQAGVERGTLYVETSFDSKEYFDRTGDWFITVTIPEEAELSEVELETISGNIEVQGVSCERSSMSSVSGTIDTEDVAAGELELETASGIIAASGLTADRLEAETISSDLELSGVFGNMETSTVSGETTISGSISERGTIGSTSGDIALSLDHAASVSARSMGAIVVNGERKDKKFETFGDIPIEVKSVSGGITVRTDF